MPNLFSPMYMPFRKVCKGLCALLLTLSQPLLAQQQLSPGARISLLTCSPGTELYTTFGHSAIRIQDTARRIDLIYNYGLFDFDTPNFYWKFLRGKLSYKLGVQSFASFLAEYREEQRTVVEQEIRFRPEERQKLYDFLQENYRPENRYYLYDFFYDNCATRIRDALENEATERLRYQYPEAPKASFRQMLDKYLLGRPWIDFGIDLVLGQPADRVADFREQMFLPDYLAQNLQLAFIDNHLPLLGPPQRLTWYTPTEAKATGITPVSLFWLLFGLLGILSVLVHHRFLLQIDLMLFGLSGLLGCLLLFMWWGTDHPATAWNYNLLWANPLLLPLTYYYGRGRRRGALLWGSVVSLIWAGLLVAWMALPQQLHPACIPLVLMMLIRLLSLLLENWAPPQPPGEAFAEAEALR